LRRLMTILLLSFFMVLGCGISAFAADDEQALSEPSNGLTLEKAVERALTASTALEKAEKDVDRAWEVRSSLREAYASGAGTVSVGDLYASLPGADDYFLLFLSSNGQWSISKKSLEMTQDLIVLQTKSNYYDIIKKLHKVEITGVSLQKAEDDYRIARAKNLAGMATDLEVKAAQSLLETEKSSLELARAELENAYRKLNKLIGLGLEERPDLVTPIEFEKLEVPSIENKVAWALSPNSNPYLWSKKEGYEITKYTWTTTEPDEAGLIDKEKASITYDEARQDTRDKVYELHDTLKTLETSYVSALEGLAAAEEGLRVTKAMYEAGLVTKNDVLDNEVALNKVKDSLLDIKSKYALTKETFEHPWLALLLEAGA